MAKTLPSLSPGRWLSALVYWGFLQSWSCPSCRFITAIIISTCWHDADLEIKVFIDPIVLKCWLAWLEWLHACRQLQFYPWRCTWFPSTAHTRQMKTSSSESVGVAAHLDGILYTSSAVLLHFTSGNSRGRGDLIRKEDFPPLFLSWRQDKPMYLLCVLHYQLSDSCSMNYVVSSLLANSVWFLNH